MLKSLYVLTMTGMKFLYGRKLSDHLNTHLGSKPYQCERCEAAFATSSSLSRHKGECGKMIQCMDCGQEFSGRSSLADHMRSVHVDLPYDCVCGKRFKWRTNLSRHKKQCPFHFKPNLSFAIEDRADEDDA